MVMAKIATKKNIKAVRKICLASSILFNLATYVFNWTAPIGAALGCVVTWTDDLSESLSEQFEAAIKEALELTEQRTSSASQHKILKELSSTTVTPESLPDLIKQTESYQVQYCTDIDAKKIIEIFEICFRECVSAYDELSKYYILSTGTATLEQLKVICEVMNAQHENIMVIKDDTAEIKRTISKFENIFTRCTYELAFALISITLFLFVGFFSEYGFFPIWYLLALISYIFAGIMSYVLKKNINFEIMSKKPYCFIPIFMYGLLSLACFSLLATAMGKRNSFDSLAATLSVLAGGLFGSMVRFIWERKQRPIS